MSLFNLTADISGVRLDKYLADEIEVLSRSQIKRVIESDNVEVDGRRVKASYLLRGGEIIHILVPEEEPDSVGAEDIPLEIIHEDHDLIVVNKPAGMVVHPGAGNTTGTLVNTLLFHFDQLSKGYGPHRPGIVHRLDKNTSGVLVVAKNDQTHRFLAGQFANREVEKKYLAVVWGTLENGEGTVDAPLIRHPGNRRKFTCGDLGRPSITRYVTTKHYGLLSAVELFPLTGRTHQLRVHMSWIGHPILGDSDYGGGREKIRGYAATHRPFLETLFARIDRQILHASRISFVHPKSRERVSFSSPLPEDFRAVMAHMGSGDA